MAFRNRVYIGVLRLLLLAGLSHPAVAEPPRIVIALPGPNVAPYLPVELMSRIGADRRAGFVLVTRYFGGGPLAAKDMLERNSDFAGLGMPALAGLRVDNPELVSIAALTQRPAYVLMARRGAKQVRGIADLRGRDIGTHSGSKQGKSTARQLAEYLLHRNGVGLDEVNFVNAGQSLVDYSAALRAGMVDAIMVNEPAATLLEQRKLAWRLADLHDPEVARKQLGGRFLYTQLATSKDTLRRQPDKARRLSTALRDTLGWMAKHSADDIVARLALPEGEEKRALARFLAAHKDIYSPNGAFGAEAMRNSEAFFHAVSRDHSAAGRLRYASFVDDRWSGRGR